MVELIRTNDLVRLSWAEAMLAAAGVETVVLDAHVSAVEGSLGVLPRRLMVAAEDLRRAREVLERAAGAEAAPW
jgi:hypothetical protein